MSIDGWGDDDDGGGGDGRVSQMGGAVGLCRLNQVDT
jgi:hypothetical protein